MPMAPETSTLQVIWMMLDVLRCLRCLVSPPAGGLPQHLASRADSDRAGAPLGNTSAVDGLLFFSFDTRRPVFTTNRPRAAPLCLTNALWLRLCIEGMHPSSGQCDLV